MKSSAQSSIEFIILVAALMFFFSLMLIVFQQSVYDRNYEKKSAEIRDLALTVQKEINIAAGASNGYRREFVVPEKIFNMEYSITINAGLVYLNSSENLHTIALPVQNVTGQIQKGVNLIRKYNDTIYLNS
jgi:hypothetical protein